MEAFLTKEFLGAFGAFAITLVVMYFWIKDKSETIKELRTALKEEREKNGALTQKFLDTSDQRATAETQVGIAFAAAQDKMADRVDGTEKRLDAIAVKVDQVLMGLQNTCKAK